MKLFFFIISLFLFLVSNVLWAQEENKKKYEKVNLEEKIENEPNHLLEKDTIEVVKKGKKKRKKKTFNKLKTRRGFTKSGSDESQIIETFFYLKKYKEPDPYVPFVFLYDRLKFELLKVKQTAYDIEKYPPKQFRIVHGPYKKKRGGFLLEEGYFYIGTMHHFWFKYKSDEELVLDRANYYKGWPAEYKMSYYDPSEKKRPKEINPYNIYGENSGKYIYFYDSGNPKIIGTLEKGVKVDEWIEYHDLKKKKYKRWTYPDNYEEAKQKQDIEHDMEWDKKGDIIKGEDLNNNSNKKYKSRKKR